MLVASEDEAPGAGEKAGSMKTPGSIRLSFILGALLFSSPASAVMSEPAAHCVDTVAKHGSDFLQKLNKISARCEILRVKGKLAQFGESGQSVNCNTSLVGYSSEANTWVPFEEKVLAQRDKYYPKFSEACPTAEIIAESLLDSPCGIYDGMTNGGEVAACIVYDGHGLIAANLQALVAKSRVDHASCKQRVRKLLDRYAKKYLSEARACAQGSAVGESCDGLAAMIRLAEVEMRIRAGIVAACNRIPPEALLFGSNCQGPFADASSAADCLLPKARTFIDRAADIVHDMGF